MTERFEGIIEFLRVQRPNVCVLFVRTGTGNERAVCFDAMAQQASLLQVGDRICGIGRRKPFSAPRGRFKTQIIVENFKLEN